MFRDWLFNLTIVSRVWRHLLLSCIHPLNLSTEHINLLLLFCYYESCLLWQIIFKAKEPFIDFDHWVLDLRICSSPSLPLLLLLWINYSRSNSISNLSLLRLLPAVHTRLWSVFLAAIDPKQIVLISTKFVCALYSVTCRLNRKLWFLIW